MIVDAIERIEANSNIENVALRYHFPGQGTYVIVDKNFNYKVISKERFSFNSKYVVMDFYSKIIDMNKAVDKKKLISSNNYLTFFCKNINKLTGEIIDNYYETLKTPENCLVYKSWIKENIFKISNIINTGEIIKIFFIADIETYTHIGRQYLRNNILSYIINIDNIIYGTPPLLNLNPKKKYLKTLTRKTGLPSLVNVDQAIKYKYFIDILKCFSQRGYDTIYVLEDGQIFPVKTKEGPAARDFFNAIIFVFKLDERGRIVILDMDSIPVFKHIL